MNGNKLMLSHLNSAIDGILSLAVEANRSINVATVSDMLLADFAALHLSRDEMVRIVEQGLLRHSGTAAELDGGGRPRRDSLR
jgi:hypothetical protein